MSNSKLIELSYYDPSAQVRLSAYADTIVLDHDQNGSIISAIRFGGYPEMVRAMADAIYGGATIEAAQNDTTRMLQSSLKSYQRQITHDGIYAVATLMAADTVQEDDRSGKHEKDEDTNLVDTEQMELQPRRCYIFCPARDQKRLFEELDHKTAAPLIPEFQDYVLSSLRQRGDLRQLEVISLKERMDAWVLDLKPQDQNVVEVLEQGLQSGDIQIPGAVPNMPDVFENVENVTGYLNTFGVTVADRIRNQFMPLFDPAKEPLSDEVLAINDCIMSRVGYSLYDAQLAVAEAVKRQLARKRVALIIAECGSGKTKIGSTALGALHGLWADQKRKDGRKSFGIVMCPSHVTQKWVREIGETLPDTYGMVVRTIQDLNRLYAMYEKGDKSVFAVFSKEQARDGYMRYPAVRWNRRRRAFLCPDCDGVIEMEISEDGSRYTVPADQFFFQKEHKKNHTCPHCGTPLWSAVNPDKRIDWVKIGEYGWVYRYGAQAHLHRTKNERVLDQLTEIAQNPDAFYPIRGAHQRFPLSTYIKKKLRGRIDGFLCDELHEYNNNSGQGDAMAELYGASRCFVGMTATLINGYSSGIFHLLYRIVPGLMLKDGKRYKSPGDFDAEYGVVENTYEIQDAEYNSNTAGDLAAWGKAVALTLLEIAQSEGRKFALVHFSGPGRFQTDVFLPGQSSLEEKLHAAETFLGGGTDFQTPLAEAERLMREGGFENADIAFITDGECSLPETCVEMLQKAQSELRFTVTGILLDEGNAGMDFSLKPFCQNIYRTSELTGDQIVGEIVLDRV